MTDDQNPSYAMGKTREEYQRLPQQALLAFSIKDGKIAQVDIIADAERLEKLDLAVLTD